MDALDDRFVTGAHRRQELLAAGVTRQELAGPLWVNLHQDRWVWSASIEAKDTLDRIRRAAAMLAGEGAVGGWAAAVLHGATGIDGMAFDRDLDDLVPEPVLLCLPPTHRTRRRTGVEVVHSVLEPDDVVVLPSGLRATSLVRTGFDLARRPGRADEALARLDALAAASVLEIADLLEYVRGHRRWRGTPQARRVIPLIDPAVRSPQESRLRYLWMVDAGLPRPLVNRTIHRRDGRRLGEVDLVDPVSGLVGEYDGAVHSDSYARGKDAVRTELLEAAGLTVVRLTSPDLGRWRARSVNRLRAQFAAAMSRDRSKDQWALND